MIPLMLLMFLLFHLLFSGFGPFKSHDVNASWSAVKELESLGLDDKYNLVVAEIPVEYDTVNDIIPKMWRSHKPHVSINTKKLRIIYDSCSTLNLTSYQFTSRVTYELIEINHACYFSFLLFAISCCHFSVTNNSFLLQLVVHVGVSGIARNLTLEQCAHNDGITMEDVKGRVPPTHCCIEGSPKKLTSELQMNVICDKVNRCGCGVTSVVSHDPGR